MPLLCFIDIQLFSSLFCAHRYLRFGLDPLWLLYYVRRDVANTPE